MQNQQKHKDAPNTTHAHGALPRWVTALSFVFAFTAMLCPAFLNKYPLSADYLNHLSRIFILYHLHDPFLGKIFEVHFGIIPNLALDGIAFALRPTGLAPNVVMKLIFALSCIVLWSGAITLTKSIHGRLQTSSLLILPISYSFVLAYGFYDFMLGAGLVLWCLSWLVRTKPSLKTSLIVVNCVSALIFFCHFGAWLILLASIFLYRVGLRGKWLESAGIAVGENVLPALLYILRIHNHFNSLLFSNIPYKIIGLISAFQITTFVNALFTALAFSALLAVLLWTRTLRLPSPWKPVILGIGALSVLAPFALQASYYVDWRLIWMTCLFFAMTVQLEPGRRWAEPLILGSVVLMLLPNMTALMRDTRTYNKAIDQFANAIQAIPRDSFVFVSSYEGYACAANAKHDPPDSQKVAVDQPGHLLDFMYYRQAPALLIPDRNSAFPYIFAHHGAEAVYFRKAYSSYFSPSPRSPVDSLLAALLVTEKYIPLTWHNDILHDGSQLSESPFSLSPFMDKWNQRFGYVIHLQRGCPGPGPYSSLFKEVARGSFFTIYKVTRTMPPKNINASTKRFSTTGMAHPSPVN